MIRLVVLGLWALALPLVVISIGFGGWAVFNLLEPIREGEAIQALVALGFWIYVLIPLPLSAWILSEL